MLFIPKKSESTRVTDSDEIIRAFHEFIGQDTYPCVAARAAMRRHHVPCLIATHMACPADDHRILHFVYEFIAGFRASDEMLHSAAILFRGPNELTEGLFDNMFWQRLQSLADLDAKTFQHDDRVDPDPSSIRFSYSLGGEAFFVIGLHPASSRAARQFKYPAIVFNPHVQFQELRTTDRYEKMKSIVRQRDVAFSGSVNPMLSDFGDKPEPCQYSGKQYERDWKCPLKKRT